MTGRPNFFPPQSFIDKQSSSAESERRRLAQARADDREFIKQLEGRGWFSLKAAREYSNR